MERFSLGILGHIVRMLMIVAIVSGILMPRMSAVLVDLLPNVTTMVICTGDGMITLTIGADGTPIEQTDAVEHQCITGNTIMATTAPPAFWRVLSQDFGYSYAIHENTRRAMDLIARLSPVRGPPVLV